MFDCGIIESCKSDVLRLFQNEMPLFFNDGGIWCLNTIHKNTHCHMVLEIPSTKMHIIKSRTDTV